MTTKTEKPKSFATKTDLKNSQNRKTKNPNVPLYILSTAFLSLYHRFSLESARNGWLTFLFN